MPFWRKKKAQVEEETILSESDAQELISQIPSFAEQHRKMANETFNAGLDYSADSIETLEKIIEEGWQEPPIFMDDLVLAFGSYLGETIKRLHGAEWKYSEEYSLYLDNVGGQNMTIFPFGKVRKRFVNGNEDSLAYYYKFICHRLSQGQDAEAQ
jgi:hypothetical protein